MLNQLRITILEQQVIVDKRLARDDAEEVDETFRCGAYVVADGVAAGGGVEDGEVDV